MWYDRETGEIYGFGPGNPTSGPYSEHSQEASSRCMSVGLRYGDDKPTYLYKSRGNLEGALENLRKLRETFEGLSEPDSL